MAAINEKIIRYREKHNQNPKALVLDQNMRNRVKVDCGYPLMKRLVRHGGIPVIDFEEAIIVVGGEELPPDPIYGEMGYFDDQRLVEAAEFLRTLDEEQLKSVLTAAALITDPLSQELIKKAAEK